MGLSVRHDLWNVICLILISEWCKYELAAKELTNSGNEEKLESKRDAKTVVEQEQLATVALAGKDELSEAKSGGGTEVNRAEVCWDASDCPHLWKENGPLSKRRVEIHPKSEGRVTLTQIEKECEESMRKQLKENQHKKKLQFNFIGKRNNSQDSSQDNKSELKPEKRSLTDVSSRAGRAGNKGANKNESDLKESRKRWMLAGEMQAEDSANQTNTAINKLTDKNTQVTNKVADSNSTINNSDPLKNNQDYRNDKMMKTISINTAQNSDSNDLCSLEQTQSDHENKVVMKELTDYEDRDLKLLKLLYEGLNSKDVGVNEVEPLVKTLKDIADKKIAMNMITHNITTKPVGLKVEDKIKSSNQMKYVNELFVKMKEYKEKCPEKKIVYNNYGSSPLNPNLINSRKEQFYPVISKNIYANQPRRTYSDVFSFPKKNFPVMLESSSGDQANSSDLALFPNLASNNSTGNKSMSDYAVFVQLIDKILGTISENNTETTELLHDLNRKLLGTSKELGSYKMLEDLVREFGNSVSKIKGTHKIVDSGEEQTEDLMRNSREVKNFRDKYMESRVRNGLSPSQPKPTEQLLQNNTSKHPNKNWSKSDELKRLQKVATELKSKIDDLLNNLEGTVSDSDDEEEDDEEDDEDEDEGEDQSEAAVVREANNSSNISTGPRRNKVNDDPYESFKKFKVNDKRKFKEYEPKDRDRLTKVVGKKPITMSNRYKCFQDKSKDNKNKLFKSKRDKREGCEQFYDKYDIYNYQSKRKNAQNIGGNSCGHTSSHDTQESNCSLPYDPGQSNQANDYQAYKLNDNSFNVFKVANEFKKVHRNMIDRRVDNSLPLVKCFQKYLGNNQPSSSLFDIKKLIDTYHNKEIGLKDNELKKYHSGSESALRDSESRRQNDSDIPHWLDYTDTEIQSKKQDSDFIVANTRKKYLRNNKYKRINNILSKYRYKRSLKNFFGYFKNNKDKEDNKLLSKFDAKDPKSNETYKNLGAIAPKDISKSLALGQKEVPASLKSVNDKGKFELVTPLVLTQTCAPKKS